MCIQAGEAQPGSVVLANFPGVIGMRFRSGKRMPGETQVCENSTACGKYTDVFPSWLSHPLKMGFTGTAFLWQ